MLHYLPNDHAVSNDGKNESAKNGHERERDETINAELERNEKHGLYETKKHPNPSERRARGETKIEESREKAPLVLPIFPYFVWPREFYGFAEEAIKFSLKYVFLPVLQILFALLLLNFFFYLLIDYPFPSFISGSTLFRGKSGHSSSGGRSISASAGGSSSVARFISEYATQPSAKSASGMRTASPIRRFMAGLYSQKKLYANSPYSVAVSVFK